MWSAPTCSAGSKRLGSQRAGTKLAVGRHLGPAERGIGLEWRRRSSGSSQRGLWAQTGRQHCKRNYLICNIYICLKSNNLPSLESACKQWITSKLWDCILCSPYLNNGRVLRQGAWWFWGLTHSQILDVTAPEDDVFKDFISGWDWSLCWAILSAKRTNWWGKYVFLRNLFRRSDTSCHDENHMQPQSQEPVSEAGKSSDATYLKPHFNKPTVHTYYGCWTH